MQPERKEVSTVERNSIINELLRSMAFVYLTGSKDCKSSNGVYAIFCLYSGWFGFNLTTGLKHQIQYIKISKSTTKLELLFEQKIIDRKRETFWLGYTIQQYKVLVHIRLYREGYTQIFVWKTYRYRKRDRAHFTARFKKHNLHKATYCC